MAGKSYMNGIIIGIALAVLALFAAKNIEVLSFIDTTLIHPIATWLAGIESIPTSLTGWEYFDYLIVAIIGAAIGLYIEVR